jgi:hypothetical protein
MNNRSAEADPTKLQSGTIASTVESSNNPRP